MTGVPETPSFRLDGRRALVAGGSRGIGFAAAAALARAGAEVAIAARDEARIGKAVRAFREAGFEVEGRVLDVADAEGVARFFAERGAFDVLVNSAGIVRHRSAFNATEDDYDRVMFVNARGAYFLAREAALRMRESGGSIIQISSQMAFVGGQERSVYCASKHAVEGMTKAMAIEWAPHGIRVNTVCPTFIRTDLGEKTLKDPEKAAWIKSKIKLGRVGEVEDVMGAVVFLASDASAMVTGTHLLVDGGWTAG